MEDQTKEMQELAKAKRAAKKRHEQLAEIMDAYIAEGGSSTDPVVKMINWTYEKSLIPY